MALSVLTPFRLFQSNTVSAAILFFAVAVAPLPFGSIDATAIAFWCVWLGLTAIATSASRIRPQHLPLIAVAAVVSLGYALVLHEQLATHPWFASPHPLWRQAGEVLGSPVAASASIARNQPFFALGAPLADMLAASSSFVLCIDRDRARQLLWVLAWSGAAYAFYGIVSYLIDPNFVLWREKVAYREVLTSTFINRNTAAVYFGACSVLWLLLLLQQFRRQRPATGAQQTEGQTKLSSSRRSSNGQSSNGYSSDGCSLVTFPAGKASAYAFTSRLHASAIVASIMLLACLTAVLMTNSRAGIVLSLLAMVIAFIALFYRDLPGFLGAAAALAASGLLIVVILQVFGGNVSGRFELQGLSDQGRLEVYRSTLKMIADHPWFGTGLGTFAFSFPAYRSPDVSMWGIWDRAHSTPLELAAELGVPLAALIVLAWIFVLAMLLYGLTHRQRDRILPVAAFAVAVLALLHSSIDFSLQIPGYAIPLFALVGAGLAQSFPSAKRQGQPL
jgi:hypothetical protein